MPINKFVKDSKKEYMSFNWEKIYERYAREVCRSRKRNMRPAREFADWLARNGDILNEFQDRRKKYLMTHKDDIAAMFNFDVCSTCVNCKINRA